MAQEEAKRIHAFEMITVTIKAAEEALSCAFQSGNKEAYDGLQNALF